MLLCAASNVALAADLVPIEPPPVVEPAGIYFCGHLGWSFTDTKYHGYALDENGDPQRVNYRADDNAFTVGIGFGYYVTDGFRVDLTGDYSGAYKTRHLLQLEVPAGGGPGPVVPPENVRRENMNVWTLMGNAYYEVPYFDFATPYVGVGVGWGWIDKVQNDDGFALAAHAGVSFAVTENLSLDIGYRFRDIMIEGPNFTDHSILAGFRIGF